MPLSESQAEAFKIPEINAHISDQFILESIAKLDDFIEDIRNKQEIRDQQNVGFANSAIVHLGTLTGTLVDQFLLKTKLLTPVFAGIHEVSSVGKAGTFPMRLLEFTKNWMYAASAVQSVKTIKEKIFVVHVDDLALFREILTQVRQEEKSLLVKLWTQKGISKNQVANIEAIISEQRPSFKKIYEPCSADTASYKINTSIEIYRQSLFDYLKMLTLSPGSITAQFNAGFISPTLNSYMNQDVVTKALKKCFKVDPNASGLLDDESQRFIAQLLAVEGVSKLVLISAVVTIWKLRNTPRLPKTSMLAKIQSTWMGKWIKPIVDLFSKISPATVAKVIAITQVAASSYSLYTIRQEYIAAKNSTENRRSPEEFKKIAKSFFHTRAIAQLEILKTAINQPGLDENDKASLSTEITNWEIIAKEFNSES